MCLVCLTWLPWTKVHLLDCSVQEADIKLCVLSLPDLLETENNAVLPDAVQSLLDPDTFLLLNKADLACSTPVKTEEKDLLDAALTRLRRGRGDRLSQAWVTSLATGGGTQEFMTGLVMALKHRLVSMYVSMQ